MCVNELPRITRITSRACYGVQSKAIMQCKDASLNWSISGL